jgi:phospholipid/cholesterol/gamma-HCH transport system substrate-binding protein
MKETLVGLIFVAGLGILAFFTIFISEGKEAFNFKEKHQITAYFKNVEGLEVGNKVRASGLEVGRVEQLRLTPENEIEAVLQLNQALSLYEGAKATVKDVSSLGGKFVEISLGDVQASPQPALLKKLSGDADPNVLSTTARVVDENRADLREIISGLKEVIQNVRSGKGTIAQLIQSSELYDKLRSSVDELHQASQKLNSSEGTLGKILNEPALYDSALDTVQNLKSVTQNLLESKGTLGRLLNEPEMHNRLESALTKVENALDPIIELAQKINQGQGSAGKFINDPQLHDELLETVQSARSALGNIDTLVQKVLQGEGTMGKLFNDDSLYTDLKSALSNITAITSNLRKGEGTLGKLLVDDSLYLEAKKVVRNLSDSLEDQREQVPVTTFTTILFNAF